jgi:hypothetical protein
MPTTTTTTLSSVLTPLIPPFMPTIDNVNDYDDDQRRCHHPLSLPPLPTITTPHSTITSLYADDHSGSRQHQPHVGFITPPNA